MTDDDYYDLSDVFVSQVQATEYDKHGRTLLRNQVEACGLDGVAGDILVRLVRDIRTLIMKQSVVAEKDYAKQMLSQALEAVASSRQVSAGTYVEASKPNSVGAMDIYVKAQEVAMKKEQEIKNEGNISIGGSVQGSAVGHAAKFNARDIGSFAQAVEQSGVDDDLKAALKQALDHLQTLDITQGDKDDVSDDIGKLSAELDKPEKDPTRIGKIFGRIKAVAPTVAAILSAAASLAKLLGGG